MAHALTVIRFQRGLPAMPLPTIRPHVSHGARGMLHVGFGISSQHEEFATLRDAFYDETQRNVCVESALFDGMETLIDMLERCDIVWGIVTNKAARLALPIAQMPGFAKRAACIVCGDTTAHTKPHPALLLHAAKVICIAPSDTLYVGDDPHDWGAQYTISTPSGLATILCDSAFAVAHATAKCGRGVDPNVIAVIITNHLLQKYDKTSFLAATVSTIEPSFYKQKFLTLI